MTDIIKEILIHLAKFAKVRVKLDLSIGDKPE